MMRRSLTFVLALGAIGLVMTDREVATTHYIWNASASVPVGLYRLQASSSFVVSDLVAIKPPDPLATFLAAAGYLPRSVLLLKHVLAVSGQTVCRAAFSIIVDDVLVGEARERDSHGRPLPDWQGCRPVRYDELFVMNAETSDSFDGRYFGMIPTSSVVGQAIPVWTNEK